jgi:hypothetical protein
MFKETVKITVTSNNKKFAKIYTIESDGSSHMVEGKVNAIVNREWPIGTVQYVSWNYI